MNSINVFGKMIFSPICLQSSFKFFFSSSFPIVAASVLRWIEFRILDPNYFKLDQGTTPVHLIIIDEVGYRLKNSFVMSIAVD